MKFIIGGIAVAIWLFGSLAQALGKKKEKPSASSGPDYRSPEEIAAAQREEIARRIRDLSQPAAPVDKQKMLSKLPSHPKLTKKQPRRAPLAQSSKRPVLQPAKAPAQTLAAPPAVMQRPRPAEVTVSALTLNRWLRPNTLHQQFILTEILQKPVALRSDHLDDR